MGRDQAISAKDIRRQAVVDNKSEFFLKNYAAMKRALHEIVDQVDVEKQYSDREVRMGNIARLVLVEVKEREV